MSEQLWYLRQEHRIAGPLTATQINTLLNQGTITPDWEISPDKVKWRRLGDSGKNKPAEPQKPVAPHKTGKGRLESEPSGTWDEERAKARNRWQVVNEGTMHADPDDPALVMSKQQRVERALEEDHARTELLLKQAQNRRVPVWGALLVLCLIGLIGYVVWIGESDEPAIQPKLGLMPDCSLPLEGAVNWRHCDKSGFIATGAKARNARLEEVNLEGSILSGSDLRFSALNKANLRFSDFRGVDLAGADLTGADLTGTDLSQADLRYAVLKGATLDGVDLTGALLDKATWVDGRTCKTGAVGQCP